MKKIKGLVAAAFTPMDENFEINYGVINDLVDYSLDKKFAGLFVCGSTGEFSALTMAERKKVTKQYVNASQKRIPIITHVGSCSIKDAIELAQDAENSGTDAICGLTPFYFRPSNVEELANFLTPIANSVPNMPFYYYHAPGITMVNFSMLELAKLLADRVENFAGIKFTNENLMDYQRCINFSDKYQMLYGKDEFLLGALVMGAKAGIGTTYNYAPTIYHNIIKYFEAGDMEKALYYQNLSQEMVAISCKYGMPSLKTLMKFAGIDVGQWRLPYTPMDKVAEEEFKAELIEADLFKYIKQ